MSTTEVQPKDFGGTWYRNDYDTQYEEFMTKQGVGWLKRKAILNTNMTKGLQYDEVTHLMTDSVTVAGVIGNTSIYPVHPNKETADAAREAGDVTTEETLGLSGELVAYTTGQTMVIHRTYPSETFQTYYIYSLLENGNMQVRLIFKGQNDDVVESFSVYSQDYYQDN